MAKPDDSFVDKLQTGLDQQWQGMIKESIQKEMDLIEWQKQDLIRDRKAKNMMLLYAGTALGAMRFAKFKR